MNKNIAIFLAAFVAGSIATLAVRSALHEPHAAADTAPAAMPQAPSAGHEHAQAEPVAGAQPVNTVCAICGMKVNPKIPTAEYQGKVIGFGCKRCPPKFAANPDLYGPAALANQVVE